MEFLEELGFEPRQPNQRALRVTVPHIDSQQEEADI